MSSVCKRKSVTEVLESRIESRSVHRAKELGWLARKMNGLGYRSWPDRLFVPPKRIAARGGHPIWVEFKRRGEEPTPEQARIHADLRARGEEVHVFDDAVRFIEFIEARSK